jgi:Ca-activated chloride channel family protein
MIKSICIFTLFFLSHQEVYAFGPPSIESNNEGLKHYKAEEFPEAFNSFADALGRDPFNPKYHLNLGDAFLKGGDIPKALAEYESASQNPKVDPETKFQSLFNAGNAAVESKDMAKALDYYQRALEIKPDSVETKTNIELALKEDKKQNKSDENKDQDKKGGGDKDQKDKKDGKDGKDKKDKDQKKDQPKPSQSNGPQPTPRPVPHGFKSESLNENDVQRILEELKRQEQEIRARQYKENKNVPENQIEKDW